MSNEAVTTLDPAAVLAAEQAATRLRAGMALGHGWDLLKNAVKRPFYEIYLRRLRAKAHDWHKPNHLGIIMDGNRRYAKELGFASTLVGHRRGADKLHEVLNWCFEQEIRVVTVWSFSLDNFHRPESEVEGLLSLFEEKTRELQKDPRIHDEGVRVRFIGRIDLLPESLQVEIRRAEEMTAHHDRLVLNIAMASGGREEIADACKRFITERRAEGCDLETILDRLDADAISTGLYTGDQPEPDLILRTSGEVRTSGFLLWQSAHCELYFSDANWPALREIDFLRALRSFDDRERRYGR